MSKHTVANGQSQTFSFTPISSGTSEKIDASGVSQVDISVVNGRYPMTVALNLAQNTDLSAGFHLA